MKKKVLLVSTVSGFIPQFEMNNVKILQEMGYEVHYAANFNLSVYEIEKDKFKVNNIVIHQVDFMRSPVHLHRNRLAYLQLVSLLKTYNFSLIHCHTPMGGVLSRFAAKKFKDVKVIYTAHGFHFFKGAPIINWLLYYTAERYFARFTDILITINEEDFQRANHFRLRQGGGVRKVNGVGIRTEDYKSCNVDRVAIRKQYGINESSYLLVSVGELSKRKNHALIIKALNELHIDNIQYLICGSGKKENEIRKLIKQYKLEDNVKLAGYCVNVKEILKSADCFVFPSLQEGLPVALMEAMASGLPVICSDIRGNRDLIQNGRGGYLVENSISNYASYIKKVYYEWKNGDLDHGRYNQEILKLFDLKYVDSQMRNIYQEL